MIDISDRTTTSQGQRHVALLSPVYFISGTTRSPCGRCPGVTPIVYRRGFHVQGSIAQTDGWREGHGHDLSDDAVQARLHECRKHAL